MGEDDLSSTHTWRGRFWLAHNPQDEQRGVLTYDPKDGVCLALVGGFDEHALTHTATSAVALPRRARRFPVIHGRVGASSVTLLDCQVMSSKRFWSEDAPHEQVVNARQLLTGVLLEDPAAEVFSEFTIELENLTNLDHQRDVMVHTNLKPDLPLGVRWKVTVDPVDPIEVTVDDLTFELGRSYIRPDGDMRRGGLGSSLFVTSYLTIKAQAPKSITQWADTEKQMQDLLTLAMDRPCAVLSATLTPSEDLLSDENASAQRNVTLFTLHTTDADPDAPAVEDREAFFTLAVDGLDFQTLMPRWMSVNNRYRTACDLILGLRYVRRGYLQTQLITAVAAAEAMHAAMKFAPPMSNAEFKKLKKLLLDTIPDERRQWLREKIGSNKPSLVQQLIELAAVPDQDVVHRVVRNVEAWAEATKKERNPVAHGGNMSADADLLIAITKVTEAVVLLNLLHLLEIPTERLVFATVDNPTFSLAARAARKQWPLENRQLAPPQ